MGTLLSGYKCNWSAALGITKDGSNNVTSWEDQSGNGYNWEKTVSNRPVWGQYPYNGYPYVSFNGSQWMTMIAGKLDLFRDISGATLFIFGKITDDDQFDYQDLFWASSNSNPLLTRFHVGKYNLRKIQLGTQNPDSGTYRYTTPPYTYYQFDDLWYNHTFVLKVGIDYINKNLVCRPTEYYSEWEYNHSSMASQNTDDTDSQIITLGCRGDTNYGFKGHLIEMVLYQSVLSTNDTAQVYEYFREKYFEKSYTIGVGANFEKQSLALDDLYNRSYEINLLGNQSYTVISDYTENSNPSQVTCGISKYTDIEIRFNANLHTITVEDGYNGPCGPGISGLGREYTAVILEKYIVKMLGVGNYEVGIRIAGSSGPGSKIERCFIYSLTSNNAKVGSFFPGVTNLPGTYIHFLSCIFYNLCTGLLGNNSGTYGVVADDGARIMENCTFFNCGFGSHPTYYGYAIWADLVSSARIQFINVLLIRNDGIADRAIYYNDTTITFDNCGSSESDTFSTLAVSYPANITDCIDGIDLARAIISTEFDNAYFLKPKSFNGVGPFNGGIQPVSAVLDYDGNAFITPYPIGAFQRVVYWPEQLPQSVLNEYELQPRCGLLDPSEYRNSTRHRTYPEWSATFTMIVSTSQLAIFRTYYDEVIKQSGLFTVPWLPALGFNYHFVQFTAAGPSWNVTAKAGYWELTLPLDIIAGVEEDSAGYEHYPPEASS